MSRLTELPLAKRVIDGYRIGYTLEYLFIEDGPQYKLEIAGPMVFQEGETKIAMDPDDLATMGPSMRLVGKTVEKTSVAERGALNITFSDESSLNVEPSEKLTAWSFQSPDKRVFCKAGGGLATAFPVD